ncbi:MAG: hypothetical protein WB816_10595 [Methylocystis sp.]
MNRQESQDIRNGAAKGNSALGVSRLAGLLALLALPFVAAPSPAFAQWDGVAGAVAGAMVRGMVNNGGGYGGQPYYPNQGGGYGAPRRHEHASKPKTHVATRHEPPARAHHASSAPAHNTASSSPAPDGPGSGGSFH